MRRRLLCIALVLAATTPACRRGAQKDTGPTGKEVVLQVGPRVVTLTEFYEDFNRAKLERGIAGDPQASAALKDALIKETIKRELILQHAQAIGMTVAPEEVNAEIARIRAHYPGEAFREMLAEQYVAYDEWVERQRNRLLVEKVVSEEVENKVTVSDDEAKAWFTAHPEAAKLPEKVHVFQILVPTEEEAKQIHTKLEKGDDFAALARAQSVSPEAKDGGDLGTFSPGEVPAGLEVVWKLKIGVPSDVLQSEYGFHIVKVTEHAPARTRSFEESKPEAVAAVKAQKVEAAFPGWLEKLADGVKVSKNDAILKAIE
ncbi:MAG TPA: peptidyl-prolyl cis-trans isomerase [bacterium]|nr:peptidyl-prolyl cis-trans isomerase [bacterium]